MLKKEREWFYSQEKEEFLLNDTSNNINAYKLKQTKQVVFEYVIDADLGEKDGVEIAQLTDLHFNYVLSEEERDVEIANTKKHRLWLANGQSIPQALFSLEGAKYSDLTVITGDILDYLSKGAMYLTKKYIFDRYPDVVCTAGGHELTKEMQTGNPDVLPLNERVSILENFWNSDFYYVAKSVGEKVIAVCINNGFGKYFDFQIEKLKLEIENARKNGKIILIFQHEPLSTRNEKYNNVKAFYVAYGNSAEDNLNDRQDLMCAPRYNVKEDNEMYSVITSNADVIKGVFVGHWHSGFYTELNGSYEKNGVKVSAKIPQILTPGTPYFDFGCLLRIIVK